MRLLVLFLLLAAASSSQAQQSFYTHSTPFVWATDGLTLRKGPSKKAAKIRVLPYGTQVQVLQSGGTLDSVLAIPAFTCTSGKRSPAFYVRGHWLQVAVHRDTGYLFDGYLSSMTPFKQKSNSYEDIDQWLLQSSKIILDTVYLLNSNNNFSTVFSNAVVKTTHESAGGGYFAYTFPLGLSIQDGFLLLNHLDQSLHFTEAELKEAESIEIVIQPDRISINSVGIRGNLGWAISIIQVWETRQLIITVGYGC